MEFLVGRGRGCEPRAVVPALVCEEPILVPLTPYSHTL